MDHKISKDMISSGMIPSGEKTQADLGRTQYGSAPSPSSLMDAYHSMYQTQKEETLEEHHQKDKNGNTIPHEDEDVNEGKIPAGLQAYLDKKKGKKEDKEGKKEDVKEYAAVIAKAIKPVMTIAKKPVVKKLVGDLATGAAMSAGSNLMSGGKQKSATGTVSASADLFDIVKGKLLDEGLNEEEIRDIMLTLTPEEIMKEMNQGPSTPVSIDKVEFPKPGKKVMPKTGATYIGKVRPKPGFKMNPASGEVEKNENV